MINYKSLAHLKLKILLIAVLILSVIGIIFILKINLPKSENDSRLVIGRKTDSISLDPAITSDSESFQVTANIYETLVKFEKGGTEVIPGLAEEWKVSEDGKTWQFKIRKGVKFHDGTDLDANVVAFNFERWMDPDSPYHTGQFIYWRYCFGGYPGIVERVTALSDETLEIVLEEPYAPFLNALSIPAFGIASQSAIIKYNETLRTHPVGTGPYVFSEWNQDENIVLTRNELYWAGDAKSLVLEFKIFPEETDRVALLRSGEVQIIDQLSDDEARTIVSDDKLQIYYRPFFNIGYLALNNSKPPFDNILVRKAVSLLVDKEAIIQASDNTLARPANSFLPPVVMGYHEGIKSEKINIDLAISLLESAGYSDGLDISLWVMDRPRTYLPNPVSTALALKEQLEVGGIRVTVKIIPWDSYIDDIKTGEHEMALIGWNGDIVDPDNFMNTLFSSEHLDAKLSFNYAFYSNPEVDRLLTQARRVSDVSFRTSLYQELQELIEADAVSIPLMHTMTAIGVADGVMGFEPQITGEEVLWKIQLINTQK